MEIFVTLGAWCFHILWRLHLTDNYKNKLYHHQPGYLALNSVFSFQTCYKRLWMRYQQAWWESTAHRKHLLKRWEHFCCATPHQIKPIIPSKLYPKQLQQMGQDCTQPRDIVMCIKCLLRARFPTWDNELAIQDALSTCKRCDVSL